MYRIISTVTATGIFIGNLNNLKISPEYRPHLDVIESLRFGMLITGKSAVYEVFWPFSLSFIVSDTINLKNFKSHFIPFSKYPKHTKD